MLNGERLRELRKKRGYSQSYLADVIGISIRQLSRYESGEPVDVSASVLIKLSNELHCSVDYLLGISDEPGAIAPEIAPDILRLARQFADLPKPLKDAIKAIIRSQSGGNNGK